MTEEEIRYAVAETSGFDLERLLCQLYEWKAEQPIGVCYIDTFLDMIFDNMEY